MKKKQDAHSLWMSRALELAARGKYTVSPNPMVGACVVKNNKLISSGFHEKFGQEHGEVRALNAAGKKARAAVLYVTLEPCSSWGKTPPCVDAVIKSGVKEVVMASMDPNPKHSGAAVRLLRQAGIKVTAGILEREAQEQNRSFFKWVRTGMPYVTLKMAQSLDGKIASRTGQSRWISSPASREFVHYLRAEQDAVMVGKNTLFSDDPFLSPRVKIKSLNPAKPWRIALDPELKLKSSARIFEGNQLTFAVVPEKKIKKIKAGAKNRCYLPVPEKKGRLDLETLFRRLGSMGAAKILVEGGGETAWTVLAENLVDEVYWITAPKILGGRTAKTSVEGDGVETPDQAFKFKSFECYPLGEDWVFHGKL